MLKYVLAGLGILFLIIILSSNAHLLLQTLGQNSPEVILGVCVLPALMIVLTLIYDMIALLKDAHFSATLRPTLGGIGILFFFLLLSDAGQELLTMIRDFPLYLQLTLAGLPSLAVFSSFILATTALFVDPPKSKKVKKITK